MFHHRVGSRLSFAQPDRSALASSRLSPERLALIAWQKLDSFWNGDTISLISDQRG